MASKEKNKARPASSAAKKSTPKTRKATKSTTPSFSENKKPVFRAGTWMAILILAALVGFAYYLKQKKDAPNLEATPTPGITYIFTSEDGLASSIEIVPAAGQTVKVEHGADGLWKLSLPFEAQANQGSVQAAADQVGTLRMLGKVDAALDILGLDKPSQVINISFTSGKTHKLEIGSVTPTDSGYYTRVDGSSIVVINKDGIDALVNLQASPPYQNTPTPSPLPPTETPVPIIQSTATPAP